MDRLRLWLVGPLCLALAGSVTAAGTPDEFRVKRQGPLEFARKPTATRDGDTVTIRFKTEAFCDVTVAIEKPAGEIVRHLACGVLGPNAPEPFEKDSLEQTLVWDGKDDQGKYVDDKDQVTVRVSLGLRARFERTLFWSPVKRWGRRNPLIAAAPEGVYVFDPGGGVSALQLFDHDGNYVRTVYPFPAGKVRTVKDLKWYAFPQDGKRLPRKRGHRQCTLLSSGTHSKFYETMGGGLKHSMPDPATGMAVHGRKIALAYVYLNRFATDGSGGRTSLRGARTGIRIVRGGRGWRGGGDEIDVGPATLAFGPDGTWLYTAAYSWSEHYGTGGVHEGWLNGVGRVRFDGDGSVQPFAGNIGKESPGGTKPGQFRVPSGLACDAAGRVYVADNLNDRVQVFGPEAKFLKQIDVPKPVEVAVDQRTGRIYVLSWLITAKPVTFHRKRGLGEKWAVPPRLFIFGSFDDPKRVAAYDLPKGSATPRHGFEIDTWADTPALWIVAGRPARYRPWKRAGIQVIKLRDGTLQMTKDFGRAADRALGRLVPPPYLRQRLYVNPANGKLYLAEGDAGVGKSTTDLLEIDPASGSVREIPLPFDAEDVAFDQQGRAYLRTLRDIARYDPETWREIPFDYGEERKSVGFAASRGKRANVLSSLRIPSRRYNHHGGMMVNARGDLVVGIHGGQETQRMRDAAKELFGDEGGYKFNLYPGRVTQGLVLIFDRRGKMIRDDAFPGIAFMHGVGIDKDRNVYAMAMAHRVLDGEPYYNEATDTLVKVRPGRAKVYSTNRKMAPVPLTDDVRPDRAPDVLGKGGARLGRAWLEQAEWFYGGVGYHGRHSKTDGFGCDCSNARFDLDYFARSFAPEVEHCSVAVLDSAGNLILRVGTYGNVDDGVPLVKAGGPPAPRSLGGDEVALFYAPYVATHTDRRLFIADPGNRRLLAVRLGYAATETVALRDVADRAAGRH
ncbi:MAG: hypothetical protein ACOC70_00345 [bacterium]